MSPDGCDNDIHFPSNVSCPIVHGDAKCPLVRALEFFASQHWIGRISGQSLKLLPEFYPDFSGEMIQSLEDRIRDNYVSRQSVSGPLSQI